MTRYSRWILVFVWVLLVACQAQELLPGSPRGDQPVLEIPVEEPVGPAQNQTAIAVVDQGIVASVDQVVLHLDNDRLQFGMENLNLTPEQLAQYKVGLMCWGPKGLVLVWDADNNQRFPLPQDALKNCTAVEVVLYASLAAVGKPPEQAADPEYALKGVDVLRRSGKIPVGEIEIH